MRIVVAGTSQFGVPSFESLIAATGCTVIGAVTQPAKPTGRHQVVTPSAVEQWAKTKPIPVMTPPRWRDEQALNDLRAWEPDILVVAAYGLIVPASVLTIPRYGCVNIHASLLPAYRGASPIAAALLNGDTETGITFMLMDAGMDTGPILERHTCAINPTDTTPVLSDRLATIAARHIVGLINGYVSGAIAPRPQTGSATLARKIHRLDGRMDWRSGRLLERKLRAYDPWPGLWSTWAGRSIKILAGSFESGQWTQPPGTIVRHGRGWGIVCMDGIFIPQRVQFEGKKPLPASSIPGSYAGFIGGRFDD